MVRWTLVLVGCLLLGMAGCDLGHHEIGDGGLDGGTAQASTACSGVCHGSGGESAPPRDTSGRSDTGSIGVGAHRAHLGSSSWHKRLECATCHKVPAQIGDPGHILNADGTQDLLPAEVVFADLGAGATWDRDTQTCTNSYCHGDSLHNVDPSTGMVAGGAGGTATKPVWTLVDGSQSACGSCHGLPPPAPHPQNDDCGQCHQTMNPGAGMVIAYPELHIDGVVEVASTQPCDSCHGSNGQSSPPKDTHGNTATTARGVGAHAQHMTSNSPWHAPIACNECHVVPGSTTDQTHLDGTVEVQFDKGTLGVPGSVWDANALTCGNTYCHGGGASPLTGGNQTTPLWTKVDGTQSQCQSCHGMPPPPPHPVDSNCGSCHPTMTPGNNTTITYPAKHIDGNVDTTNDQPCDSCHGSNGNSAPPLDTQGNMTTDVRGVGAHRSHLDPSTWRAPIACDACHKVPASVLSIGHIDSALPAEVIFGSLAGNTASWNGATCSNVYCHGATLTDGGGGAGGTATKPAWTVVDGSQSQCGSCHGTPPPPPHPVDSDCGKCHNTMTAGGGLVITDPSRHIDGNLDVNTDQACNSCHGSANSNAPPQDTAGNTATNTRGVGAHQSHLNPATLFFKPIACNDCHKVPGTVNSVGHIDTPLPAELTFSSRAGTSPTWNGAACSNVYCHGATLTDGSGGAGGTATTPIWNKVDGTQAACTSCHGFPPPPPHPADSDCGSCHMDVVAGQNMKFSDTTKHIDGNLDVNANQACNSCHGSGTNDAPPQDTTGGTTTTLRGVGAHQAHVLTSSTWHKVTTCDECHKVPSTVNAVGHIDTPLPAELTFSGLATGSSWNGSACSSYCHGSTLNAGGSATSPLWTKVDGTQSQCTSCHGNPPPSPHPQDSNCTSCHDDGGTGGTFSNPAQHIDGTVQVTQVHPAGYDAREMHGYDFDKMGSSTCATSGCHGTALNGGTTGGPSCTSCHASWQTDCKFCHGGTDNQTGAPPQGVLAQTAASDIHVGAHTKHVVATGMHAAWDCTMCHTKPSTALTPGHVDGTGGVVQAEVKYSSLNPSATFNAGTGTCSNLYCHGSGRTSNGTATWTSTTALSCTSCHGAPPGSGSHGDHRKYSCSTCHQSTIASGSTTITTPAQHVDGQRQVKFSGGGTYTATNKSCSGLGNGCHGTRTW